MEPNEIVLSDVKGKVIKARRLKEWVVLERNNDGKFEVFMQWRRDVHAKGLEDIVALATHKLAVAKEAKRPTKQKIKTVA